MAYLRHVLGFMIINIGNNSSLPASISNIRTILDKTENSE